MRICAISLPELRVELASAADGVPPLASLRPSRAPLAVVVAPPPMTEAKLLGNTRLSVVSREARALGVLPGHTIAQARARAANLAVRIVRPNAVVDVLSRIAEFGLAFGACVSFSAHAGACAVNHRSQRQKGGTDHDFGDIVWIDVTGCAHLHASGASSIFDGETLLASRVQGAITSLGHTCSVAIADGPRVAAMLACSLVSSVSSVSSVGHRRGGRRSREDAHAFLEPVVVRSGENAAAVAPLPVWLLPLPPDDVRWLTKIGVRTIQELRDLPREGVGLRLGARARDVLALAFGEDRAPLAPYVPPEVPEEEAELEYGVEGNQALTFVVKTLTDRIATRLQGRGVSSSKLSLELRLDAALLPQAGEEEEREAVVLVELDLPAPLRAAGDLLAAFRPKIERLVLAAPVLAVKLRAPVLVHQRAVGLSLFEPTPRAERALPRLVAELVSDLGADAVSSLVLGDSWVPVERSRLARFAGTSTSTSTSSGKKARTLRSSVPEPTRLLEEPIRIGKDDVKITRHLSRVEGVDWWRSPPTRPTPPGQEKKRTPVDYVQGWTEEGAALVEIDRKAGTMSIRGWFD